MLPSHKVPGVGNIPIHWHQLACCSLCLVRLTGRIQKDKWTSCAPMVHCGAALSLCSMGPPTIIYYIVRIFQSHWFPPPVRCFSLMSLNHNLITSQCFSTSLKTSPPGRLSSSLWLEVFFFFFLQNSRAVGSKQWKFCLLGTLRSVFGWHNWGGERSRQG